MDIGLAIDNLNEKIKSGLKDRQRDKDGCSEHHIQQNPNEVRECEYQRKGIPGRRNGQCKVPETGAEQRSRASKSDIVAAKEQEGGWQEVRS